MDVELIRLVVVALGVISCVCLIGVIYLSVDGGKAPEILSSVLATALGALVGILATPRPPKGPSAN